MLQDGKLLIGVGEVPVRILPEMANRHGLICGATGTGKTVALKVMAESFSELGVPVFLADIKGDLAGCAKTGERTEAINKRLRKLGLDPDAFVYRPFPVRFWDIRCVPLSAKWAHPCWQGSWTLPTCRRVF